MSLPKILLTVMLAALLPGCSEDEPAASKNFDPVTAADASIEPGEPAPPPVTPESTPAAVDPTAARVKQATEYFEVAKLRADERLQAAEQDCRTLELEARDDCTASATAVHESELAAARVEYATQQAQAEGE